MQMSSKASDPKQALTLTLTLTLSTIVNNWNDEPILCKAVTCLCRMNEDILQNHVIASATAGCHQSFVALRNVVCEVGYPIFSHMENRETLITHGSACH